MQTFDYLVVGAGYTGLRIITTLLQKLKNTSKKICLIDIYKVGGSYLYSADLPIKYLGQEALAMKCLDRLDIKNIPELYIESLAKISQKIKDNEQNLHSHLEGEANLTILTGQASFLSKNLVEIKHEDSRQLIAFDNLFLATGKNKIVYPNIKGIDQVDFLHQYNLVGLEKLPESLLVLGFTIIGLKVAQIFSTFGVKVVVIENQTIKETLPEFDRSVLNYTLKEMMDNGVDFLFETEVLEVKNKYLEKSKFSKYSKTNSQIAVRLKDGSVLSFSKIFIQIQEDFQDDTLKLANLGVGYSNLGVFTDIYGQTSNSKVFAFGQIANQNQHTNLFLANYFDFKFGNNNIVYNAFNQFFKHANKKHLVLYELDLFTKIFTIGLTTQKAKNLYGSVAIAKVFSFVGNKGFLKVVYLQSNLLILGVSGVGDFAYQCLLLSFNLLKKRLTLTQLIKNLNQLKGILI